MPTTCYQSTKERVQDTTPNGPAAKGQGILRYNQDNALSTPSNL